MFSCSKHLLLIYFCKEVGQSLPQLELPYNEFKLFPGRTYFFKEKSYWKFNDQKMKAESTYPRPSAGFWMNCSTFKAEDVPNKTSDKRINPFSSVQAKSETGNSQSTQSSSFTTSANIVYVYCFYLIYFLPR